MEAEHRELVAALAELYRRHFAAVSYAEGARLLAQAEAFQQDLEARLGSETAREIDRLAYALGHG